MSVSAPTISRAGKVLLTAGAITALVFGTALSAQAAPEPSATISGTPDSSNTLTANPNNFGASRGDLTGQITYSFAWYDGPVGDGTVIDGQGGNTLVLTNGEVGHSIYAIVTATDQQQNSDDSQTNAMTVVANTVAATTAPTLTGGTAVGDVLTITPGDYSGTDVTETYDWFFNNLDEYGDPVDGGDLSDTGTTHTLDGNDVGKLIGVNVTAKSENGDNLSTQLVTATAITGQPAAPFATDAGLTSANQGGVTGSVTGTTASFTVPGASEGDTVFVYGYSTPTPLGHYKVSNGQIVVNFSALPAGAHKLLVIAADGTVIGWFGVSVLAATGANVNPMEWYLAGGALLLGALLVGFGVYIRRRTAAL